MQLNRSTDYAIQMLVYLAKARKTVSSSKLAAAMGVSHRYLLQISAKLRAAGFIRVAHGSAGGMIAKTFRGNLFVRSDYRYGRNYPDWRYLWNTIR